MAITRTFPARPDKDGFWAANRILEEHKNKGYLIEWDGVGKDGTPFTPSWVPKAYANALLVKSWKEEHQKSNDEGDAAPAGRHEERKKKRKVKRSCDEAPKKKQKNITRMAREDDVFQGIGKGEGDEMPKLALENGVAASGKVESGTKSFGRRSLLYSAAI